VDAVPTSPADDSALRFDPYGQQFRLDPYPTYARMREQAPVYRNQELDFWALTRYDDVDLALRDHRRFSSVNGALLDPSLWGPNADKTLSFTAMDPPRHTAMRRLVAAAFSPSQMAALEPEVRRIVGSYLDPAIEAGTFDFIAELAANVPMDVISELLGIPRGEREEARRLMDQATERPPGSTDVPEQGAASLLKLIAYLRDLTIQRRRQPRDDLTSTLAQGRVDGRPLSDEEVIAALILFIAAGNETTARLLGTAWYWVWRHPQQRARAFGGRVVEWIEETLRFDPPVQYILRTATEDVEVSGTVLPRGARVMLLIAAANRDPRVFPDPDHYDLLRDTRRAIAFGVGPHFCLGAPLARLEARIVLGELVNRVNDDYDIDAGSAEPAWTTNTRGFAHLPTTVTPR